MHGESTNGKLAFPTSAITSQIVRGLTRVFSKANVFFSVFTGIEGAAIFIFFQIIQEKWHAMKI